ncbi:RecD2 [Desulforapulum autotrophicum HRM2]|uniref:RecD2 n=1 Tax=Desulforapulum autotrophicum (strain ATCC 43914 / DSM 3382 / VKM B-1955 / HRM2) TaxID=177437 RepID=C0QI06_DESAH|nr:exodeoxyribonuclease V subunit alpha [Desulforapulum autotrophicum]ACN15742.1 RecD2 [Desulforapulum autotrophicum HRM2]
MAHTHDGLTPSALNGLSEFPDVLQLVETWTTLGWLRPLDRAFVVFLHHQEKDAGFLVLLGAALVSHQLARGHICLDLGPLLADPDGVLALPPEGMTAKETLTPSRLLSGVTQDLWEQHLDCSPLVGGDTGNTPLALVSGRLYLRRYWDCTRQVAEQIKRLSAKKIDVPHDLEQRLDGIFGAMRTPEENEKTEIHWQSVAAAIAATNALSIISGGPGTGKTTTVVQLLGILQTLAMEAGRGLRISLAAPTGKAAARLTESIAKAVDRLSLPVQEKMPKSVSTLHRLLGSRPDSRNFIHDQNNPLHVDLLVVDEASMIDLEMMNALLQAIPPGARLILLGDKDQLASVEAGSVLGDLCESPATACFLPATVAFLQQATGFDLSEFSGPGREIDQQIVVLRKSHRFGEHSGIGALAGAVNQGDKNGVAEVWRQGFSDIFQVRVPTCHDNRFHRLVLDGHSTTTGKEGPQGYRVFLETLSQGPGAFGSETDWLKAVLHGFNQFQVLTPLRRGEWGVEALNLAIADVLYRSDLIDATQGWYPGRPVLVTRNDYSLGLMNGDMGIVAPTTRGMRVVFPMGDGSLKLLLPSRLSNVETVYAMTVHKSQGSEFDHTAMVLPGTVTPVITRELVYTGITRARSWFTLVCPHEVILAAAVEQRTQRASGLGELIG